MAPSAWRRSEARASAGHPRKSGIATRALLCRDLRRTPREPDDVQSRARPVGTVDEAAIVDLDVVGLNHLGAGGSDIRIAVRMADSIRAKGHRVLVRRGNEIGDLLHGKRVADVEDASARVEPREDGELPVVGGIERLGARVVSEPPAAAAEISRVFWNVERRKRPWGRFIRDIEQEAEVRSGTASTGARLAVLPSPLFRSDHQEVAGLQHRMALESGNRHAIHRHRGVRISSVVGLRALVKAVSNLFRSRIWMTPFAPVP